MAVKVRPQRRLSAEELMLSNCGVGESLGLQGDPPSPSQRKPTLNIHWRTEAEAEAPILWPPDTKSSLIRKDPGKD